MRAWILGFAAFLASCTSMEAPVAKPEWTLLIHGGAGVMRRADMTPDMDAAYRAGLNEALDAGSKILAAPRSMRSRRLCWCWRTIRISTRARARC